MKKKRPKSASSRRWIARQTRDVYVRKAHDTGARSRAAFKIEQLDAQDRLFRPGQRVLDLGAAPGGWSQYLARKVGPGGKVVAVDLLPMSPLPGVTFIEGDFLEDTVQTRVTEALDGQQADAVVSDMAPNLSGVKDRDEARSRELAEAALAVSGRVLREGGAMVVKIFESGERKDLVELFRIRFRQVTIRKPDASRRGSAECYLVARGYNRGASEA